MMVACPTTRPPTFASGAARGRSSAKSDVSPIRCGWLTPAPARCVTGLGACRRVCRFRRGLILRCAVARLGWCGRSGWLRHGCRVSSWRSAPPSCASGVPAFRRLPGSWGLGSQPRGAWSMKIAVEVGQWSMSESEVAAAMAEAHRADEQYQQQGTGRFIREAHASQIPGSEARAEQRDPGSMGDPERGEGR
jgi:hypothetical protein